MNLFIIDKTKRKFLKPITLSFIFANIADVISTIIALSLGAVEMNIIFGYLGLEITIIVKFILVALWCWFFEKFWIPSIFWIAPAIIWLIVLSNMVIIFILEIG
jgi:hypothetical protein